MTNGAVGPNEVLDRLRQSSGLIGLGPRRPGETVLLIHGLARSSRSLLPVALALRALMAGLAAVLAAHKRSSSGV